MRLLRYRLPPPWVKQAHDSTVGFRTISIPLASLDLLPLESEQAITILLSDAHPTIAYALTLGGERLAVVGFVGGGRATRLRNFSLATPSIG